MDYFDYIYLTICLYDIGIKQKDVISVEKTPTSSGGE